MNYDAHQLLNRINFLWKNPVLAVKSLNGGDNYLSNCHGTVAHVLGVEKTFKKMVKKSEDFLSVEGRPAYADRDLMKTFLETNCKSVKENSRFGDIVALWSRVHRQTPDMPKMKAIEIDQMPAVKTIEHTAILIDYKLERIFHEQETGRPFEFSTIDEYISQWFPHSRKRGVDLFVDFYRVK